MGKHAERTGLRGLVIDAPTFGAVEGERDGAVVFEDGRIVARGRADEVAKMDGVNWLASETAQFPVVLPGLIDVHTHLPQYPAVAKTEAALLPWLNRHIFPLERSFRGEGTADLADAFFYELAANGTTTAMLYTVIWEEGCEAAFRAAEKRGVRAVVGKVMMDEGSYGDLEPEPACQLSLEETERLCHRWHGAADGLLEYAVSPRFAVTCSEQLMRGAAAIAGNTGAFIQTHLSENHHEIDTVAARFPGRRDYTDVYDCAGLLGSKTVLGHAIHLSAREVEVVAERGACVAHCPTSNLFLNSGLMPLDVIRDAGIRVGLGSDVAGGPELNLWQVMREAINVQKARAFAGATSVPLTPVGAFHLATAGGASVLGKADVIGQLRPGFEADIVVVDLADVLPLEGRFSDPTALEASQVIDACVYRAGPRAVAETWVRGRPVFRRSGSGQ